MSATLVLALLFPPSTAFSINAGDFWTVIQDTSAYQSLDSCSRDCILKENNNLTSQNTPCISYGCVCTGTTDGLNYLQALADVKECAINAKCADPNLATTGLADVCAVYAAGIAQPVVPTGPNFLQITGPGYDGLTNCGKWCLNGCRDASGIQNEQNCGTTFFPPYWGDYRGLADSQNCATVDCLCGNAKFDSVVTKLIESSQEFCGMPISTIQAPYPPYDNMQNVLVNFCLRAGYPHHNFSSVIVGAAPTGNSSISNSTNSSSNTKSKLITPRYLGWSSPEKASIIVSALACVFAFGSFAIELLKFKGARGDT
ncbi:hypothetical protein BT63DRAFT_419986 [Microthyrium microscopicum]|uniref:Extracellular membrane protein CFEM domain-containing protein n=1 Tax=Microthyrium microscopicum TaxID=703497 RepID=A0A6A6UR16_9PEZI|nr:hypothetical protein BT63DRAFT_419986 [Microthyrium microscopicum]